MWFFALFPDRGMDVTQGSVDSEAVVSWSLDQSTAQTL